MLPGDQVTAGLGFFCVQSFNSEDSEDSDSLLHRPSLQVPSGIVYYERWLATLEWLPFSCHVRHCGSSDKTLAEDGPGN